MPLRHVKGDVRCRAALGLSQTLGTFAFLGSFFLKIILKIIFYDCIGIKMDIWILYIKTFLKWKLIFSSHLKRTKTFLWAPKNIVGCRHWAYCTQCSRRPCSGRRSLYGCVFHRGDLRSARDTCVWVVSVRCDWSPGVREEGLRECEPWLMFTDIEELLLIIFRRVLV